jgi:hypothetical protein
MKTKSCLVAAGWCCASLAAYAQSTLILTPSSLDLTVGPYQDRANFVFPTPAVSLVNYNAVEVKFSAPEGYAWRFDPTRTPTLTFSIWYGSTDHRTPVYGGAPWSIDYVPGMSGTATANNNASVIDSVEGDLGFEYSWTFDRIVEFTSFNVTTPCSATLDAYQRQTPLSTFSGAYMDGSMGQLSGGLTLILVPEPSIAAFAMLGGLMFIVAKGNRPGRTAPGRQ